MYPDAPLRLIAAVASDLVRSRRNLKRAMWNYLDSRSLAFGAGRIPTVTIFEIAPSSATQSVRLQNFYELPAYETGLEPNIETGSVTAREAFALVALAALTPAQLIIEFGTSFGDTSLVLALNTPPDARIFTNDWPERPAVGVKLASAAKVRQVFAKTQEWDLAEYRGKADFVFVDAAHAYADVVADSQKAIELVAPGGMVCWHDYRHGFRHDVVRALDELSQRLPLVHIKYTSLVVYRRESAS